MEQAIICLLGIIFGAIGLGIIFSLMFSPLAGIAVGLIVIGGVLIAASEDNNFKESMKEIFQKIFK